MNKTMEKFFAEDQNPFAGTNIVSCYTWDDAVADGMFVDVSEMAKSRGFTLPVAITQNLYGKYLEVKEQEETGRNVNRLLQHLHCEIKAMKDDDNRLFFLHEFDNVPVDVWAVIEGRSPDNPEPVCTILLPEDN